MPSICLLTPTRNRSRTFALLERWVYGQTRQPDAWVVVNDGHEEYRYTQAQLVLQRTPGLDEGHSLPLNILAALPYVKKYDYVAIAEDDDWWHPQYLERQEEEMSKGVDLVGFSPSHHYNLRSCKCRTFRKDWCNLGSTSFRRETMLGAVKEVCTRLAAAKSFHVDVNLWAVSGIRTSKIVNHHVEKPRAYHVGLKGLPGEPGIGMGHKATSGDPDGPQMPTLLNWTGQDAYDRYRSLMTPGQ